MIDSIPKISFDNVEHAYAYKSESNIKQALWMYNMLTSSVLGPLGKAALKFAVNAGLPVKGVVKRTLYRHFVGGETLADCIPIMHKLGQYKVWSILDYSVEGFNTEEDMEGAAAHLRKNIEFSAAHPEAPICVFKVSGIAPHHLLEKVSAREQLSKKEETGWQRALKRFDSLIDLAASLKQPIMIDAEESWIQDAIDELALAAMRKHNKELNLILNTYQMYRKAGLPLLKKHGELAREEGWILGAKLVRGAYQEKERARALEQNHPDPIQLTKLHTDHDYNLAVEYCFEYEHIHCVIGTHNEASCFLALELMAKAGVEPSNRRVWFSQLYGMCDHISFNLAAGGYNVAKYVPYGPVPSVVPYLIRRANENSSVAGQSTREMALLRQELKRREAERAAVG